MSALRLLVVDAYTDAGRATLQAAGCTPAGILYERALRALDPSLEIEVLDAGRTPAGALRDYDGLVWTGSNLTIHEDGPLVREEIALARAALEAGVPSFGSCWAAQLAVVLAGGACAPNPRGREFGVARKITLTAAGRAHPMYIGKPACFDGFTSHEDEITHLPPAAVVLAENAFTRVQAVHVTWGTGVFWAVQYHPEYDLREVARLSVVRRAQLTRQGFFRDEEDAARYASDLEALHEEPSMTWLASRMGLDDDVLAAPLRALEIASWLRAVRAGTLRLGARLGPRP